MTINCSNLPWPLNKRLISLLQQEISAAGVTSNSGVVLNFRDTGYDASRGGFHPVEIAVNADGGIEYITDFAYFGSPPYAELAKEIDFDFTHGAFQHMGRELPIMRGQELFKMWESNFIDYHQVGVYTITVEPIR